MGLKKLMKKMKQLQIEGFEISEFPEVTQDLLGKFSDLVNGTGFTNRSDDSEMDSLQ